MRSTLKLLALAVVLALPTLAHAEDVPVGQIVSSGASTNNLTTASTFTIPGGVPLAIQCDAPAFVLSSTIGSSFTVSSTTGEYVASRQWWPLGPPNSAVNVVAIIPVSGTVTCTLFQIRG